MNTKWISTDMLTPFFHVIWHRIFDSNHKVIAQIEEEVWSDVVPNGYIDVDFIHGDFINKRFDTLKAAKEYVEGRLLENNVSP